MPMVNGEKWACASCIKGHRVSGCTHTDRELFHINPKGRPVKQCEHCRGARKSKSHHARCECGDKKDKDKAKDKGDAKVEDSNCGCHDGSKCACGLKKEPLDLKLDTAASKLIQHGSKNKPRLTSTHSESTLTVFANGHHKPCHRLNNAAHVSGAPYKIPRPHTLHGPSAFAHYSHENLENTCGKSDVPTQPQRSMDTLSLSNNQFHYLFGSADRSADSLPLTPLTGTFDGNGTTPLDAQDPFGSQGSSTALGQDGQSPSESLPSDTFGSSQWWTTPMPSTNGQFPLETTSTSPSQEYLPNLDNDWAIPSAGLGNPLWSAGDLPLIPNKLTDSVTQPISHSGESNKHSAPGMTTSSSAQSDIGDPNLFGDLDFKDPTSAVNETTFWADTPAYRLASSSAPSDLRQAPTSMPTSTSGPSPDFDFLANVADASTFEENIGFNLNPMAFQTTGVDDIQTIKNVTSAPASGSASQVDLTAAFSTADFNEGRSITVPNNIDDVSSNNPWLPMLDSTSNTFGLPSLDGPLEAGFDMPNYQGWL